MYIERGRKSGYKNVATSRGGWGRYSRPLINLLAPEGGGGGCQLQVYQLAEPKPVAKFLVPDWGEIVDSGIRLSFRPARLHRQAGWCDHPMPESTISPQLWTKNLTSVLLGIYTGKRTPTVGSEYRPPSLIAASASNACIQHCTAPEKFFSCKIKIKSWRENIRKSTLLGFFFCEILNLADFKSFKKTGNWRWWMPRNFVSLNNFPKDVHTV